MSSQYLHRLFYLSIAAIIGCLASLSAVVPDQTMVERALKENRYFLEFINVSVSNFGTQKNQDQLKEANRSNFDAHRWYLRSNFVQAYLKIRASQEVMRDLYADLLSNRYLVDAQILLDNTMPDIIKSKDKLAERYINLGYRDYEVSRQFLKVGQNSNRFLFSNKIRYYIDGIKRARRAKRFAFWALIESKTPLADKKRYKTQTIDEALNVNEFLEDETITSYELIRNTLTNMLNRRLFENNNNYFLHHDDNYNLINKEKKSVMQAAIDDLYKSEVKMTTENKDSSGTTTNNTEKKEEKKVDTEIKKEEEKK